MKSIALLAAAQLAAAHFGVDYPEWRANTLSSDNEDYSQWVYPCAGVPADAGNRTDWPLAGGSVKLDLHHPWTYIFINLGLGDNVTNFNYTLTPEFWNSTGKGTLCVPELKLPTDLPVSDGTKASLQFVTLGESGNALYNCADITFRSSAKALSGDECKSTENVTFVPIKEQGSDSGSDGSDGSGGSDGSDGAGDDSGNAGSVAGVNMVALSTTVGLALAFVFGMSL